MSFPDSDFSIDFTTGNDEANIYSELSTATEAFFEGADKMSYKGAPVNFSNSKIVLREIGSANKHDYTNRQMVAGNSGRKKILLMI